VCLYRAIPTVNRSEQVSLAVTLYVCIQEVVDSNLGRDSSYTQVLVVFLSPSRQILEQYLDYAKAAPFQDLSN
jgi:hypothetical protein